MWSSTAYRMSHTASERKIHRENPRSYTPTASGNKENLPASHGMGTQAPKPPILLLRGAHVLTGPVRMVDARGTERIGDSGMIETTQTTPRSVHVRMAQVTPQKPDQPGLTELLLDSQIMCFKTHLIDVLTHGECA